MSDCLFCRIAAREVAAHVVCEDDQLFAFLDIGPIRPGHTLIIPKQHFPYFDDLPAALAASTITLGQTLAAAMKRTYGVERVAFLFAPQRILRRRSERPADMTVLDTQIDVRTVRLALRPPRDSDAVRLHTLFCNWEVIRWLDSPPWPYALSHAREFIAVRKGPHPDFITSAIVLDGALIGVIDAIVKPAGAIQRERGYAIGYWLGQPYWGCGYMSEAARGFIAHVFATISADAICSEAFRDNAASLRIQEKLGFRSAGEAMSFSNPHQKDMPHVNTMLTRACFALLNG